MLLELSLWLFCTHVVAFLTDGVNWSGKIDDSDPATITGTTHSFHALLCKLLDWLFVPDNVTDNLKYSQFRHFHWLLTEVKLFPP